MKKTKKFLSVVMAGISALSLCGIFEISAAAEQPAAYSAAAASTALKVGDTVKYSGDVYATSYGTGTPVKVNGTFKIAQILSDTSRKCRVQLENVGWVSMEALTGAVETPSAEIKVGSVVKYSGDVYATSYGTGTPVKVNGTYTIAQILSDTSRKCRVQLKGIGWVTMDSIKNSNVVTPPENNTTEIKVGSVIKYSGDVYATSYGTGTPVKVNGTYTIAQILSDTSRKCRVQLKGIGWVTMDSIKNSNVVTPPENTTTEIKVGSVVKYSGNVYATSYGTGTPVKVNGTYTIAQILSDTSRKCRVQLKGIGWVSMSDLTGTNENPPENNTTEIKVGSVVKYSGDVYATSYGTGTPVKVNGTFTVAQILSDTSRKCRVQLKGIGWVSMEALKGEIPQKQPEIKVGDIVKYSGDVYATSNGGKCVKVNGTFTVSAVIANRSVKYRIQLKGIGWISADNLVLG